MGFFSYSYRYSLVYFCGEFHMVFGSGVCPHDCTKSRYVCTMAQW